MKEIIRNKAKELGVDLVGFLNLKDYKSPLEMMKSPRFFRHMQYLQFFIHYHCDNCTRFCPEGKL